MALGCIAPKPQPGVGGPGLAVGRGRFLIKCKVSQTKKGFGLGFKSLMNWSFKRCLFGGAPVTSQLMDFHHHLLIVAFDPLN